MPFNHTDLPLLPTFSDFPALRKFGELYCDRSVQIAKLAARKPGLFYLGRPRMFGRTFLLTTLKALFKEGAAVFDGLAGEGLWLEKAVQSRGNPAYESVCSFLIRRRLPEKTVALYPPDI